MTTDHLLPIAITASQRACEQIMDVYNTGDFGTEAKDDKSPLTIADKRAHQAIVEVLEKTGLPILSEEGKSIPYGVRQNWENFWLVDPLDGTKEFIKKNGEFTVNIALIHRSAPILGVVAIPVTNEIFHTSSSGVVLMRDGVKTLLSKRESTDLVKEGIRVVASRSHMNEETQSFINKLKNPVMVSRGSSLKFLLIAEDKADVYPRFGPTMEWDTAAAHAIINAAGLKVFEQDKQTELQYNKPNLLNPNFLVA